MHIAPKELVPIIAAIAVWGTYWAGQRICCLCDNMAVVFAVNKGSAKDPQLMRLLRTLFFICARFTITVSAGHIAGDLNSSADALSRNYLPLFFSLNPHAHPQPTVIPTALQELLLDRSLRWTSPRWTKLFVSFLDTVSPPPPKPATPQPSVDSSSPAKLQASGTCFR